MQELESNQQPCLADSSLHQLQCQLILQDASARCWYHFIVIYMGSFGGKQHLHKGKRSILYFISAHLLHVKNIAQSNKGEHAFLAAVLVRGRTEGK